jgi:hypothetical protein
MSFDDALDLVARDEKFKGTVYAMNTLLIHKGIYSREEFERLFVEWVQKELKKESRQGHVSTGVSALSS